MYSNSDESSVKKVLSNQVSLIEMKLTDPNNVSGILCIKKCCSSDEIEESTEEMYPLTDSFINNVISLKNDNTDISQIINNYDFNIPKDMNLEEAVKTLVKENLNIRLYSKDIEDELKEVIKTNEMLENENNDLEIKMKNDAISKSDFSVENENMSSQFINKINDIKLNMMQIVLNYITNLNSINDDFLSDQGVEKYYKAFEEMIEDVSKLTNNTSTASLQSSVEDNMKKNIEFEFFKYKNNHTFSINECNNRINELKHNITSLKKEKEVLSNENREMKNANNSIDSDIGGSKTIETQSIISVASDCQESKSMYEMGENSLSKNSKFSKLTNSAKRIIKNTSNKKLFKDKKSRSRGFSVSLPVKRK
ncbi:hypothetical protein PIROE2DRAFT_59831 [Piromyces sp. E2]|nr:hypothetical protein PIROE2DRAFT_59831 [Piromyces sp. E2]|eukprot:OUM65723.1 hypothetical protein PIROE2DRAFT_59831 [Piromyces sp. E2]